jgi:hypothetical protein
MIGQRLYVLIDGLGALGQGAQCDSGTFGYRAVAVLGAIENAWHGALHIVGTGRRKMRVWARRTGVVL